MSDSEPPVYDRQHKLALILGAPASGKTTLFEGLIEQYRESGRPVVIFDPNNNFPHDPDRVWPRDGDVELWLAEWKAARERSPDRKVPTLLAFDDADKFLGSYSAPKGVWRDLFTSFRHWYVDILLNSRRTQGVPKDVIESADTLYLFRAREVHGRAYLERLLGDDIGFYIPREPYRYIRVDADTGRLWAGETEPRDS